MSRAVVWLAGVLMLLAACARSEPAAVVEPPGVRVSTIQLPSQVLGLEVVEEVIGERLEGIAGTYLESIGLFSFREDDELLRGTLQVGLWNDVTPEDRDEFTSAVVAQLGASVPVELRVGRTPVHLSAGDRQNIYTWFADEGFYVLTVRNDYRFPRGLLRSLLESTVPL